MDNFHLDIKCQNKPMFLLAVQIAFCRDDLETSSMPAAPISDNMDGKPKSQKATHYMVGNNGFSFFWHEPSDKTLTNLVPLPYPMEWRQAAEMAWEWVVNHAEYERSDHIGDAWSERAWRVTAGGDFYCIAKIQSVEALIGK